MEDIVQRVFSILLAVIIFFLLPLYIAFEKKDDISYVFALKITTNFVDSVVEKGYLTMDMYDEFTGQLSTTGNVYDISMEYVAKQYNPVIQILEEKTNVSGDTVTEIVKEYDYIEKKVDFEEYDKNPVTTSPLFNGVSGLVDRNKAKAQVTYKLSERKYSTDQILDFISGVNNNFVAANTIEYSLLGLSSIPATARMYGLSDEGLLVMNTGDQFTITIQNKNTTVATVLFNTLTFGANAGNDTKVYVNYGGTVKNQEYKVNLLGDVNGDAIVDEKDTDLVDDYESGSISLTTVQKIAADADMDGDIDDDDKTEIENFSYYRH